MTLLEDTPMFLYQGAESKDPWNNYVSGGEGGLARVLAPHHQMEAVQMSRYAQDNVVSKLWPDTLDM